MWSAEQDMCLEEEQLTKVHGSSIMQCNITAEEYHDPMMIIHSGVLQRLHALTAAVAFAGIGNSNTLQWHTRVQLFSKAAEKKAEPKAEMSQTARIRRVP